ncbi:hypothetical protein [Rhizosaccharibacter radicis]|uniref:Flagellar assembly protein FliH/Type III secretion system HrpE domain-containing protein n=1 Tax=Rhizosaccharibacter radicis TaxID=2782605 RepID=A0ABT1VSA3_9PROT|nr:hypothetical protein [Acetobacteraceae bacterium KSS12]
MRASSVAGVLYAEDFDEPDADLVQRNRLTSRGASPAEIAPPPAPVVAIEPTFSLSELQMAAERGREEGRVLQRQEAEAAQDRRRIALLEQLNEAVQASRDGARRLVEARAAAATDAVLTMLAAALPAACAHHGLAENRAVLEAILPGLRGEPEIVVRVHPSSAEEMRALLDDLAEELETGTLSVSPSPRLLPGDLRVSWRQGQAVRDTAAICRAVHEALTLLPPPIPADPEDDHHES